MTAEDKNRARELADRYQRLLEAAAGAGEE